MNDKNMMDADKKDGHAHVHDLSAIPRMKLLGVIILNLTITIAEIIGGVISGSLALLSDSLHNLSDTASIILSYFALKISVKKRSISKTYGYKRAQVIAAFVNAAALILISAFLIFEAVKRFQHQDKIDGNLMIIVALIGLAGNLISVFLLNKDSHDNMNIKASYLHLMSDTISSIGVVLGGIAIKIWSLFWIDPAITIIVALYIVVEAYKIVKKSTDILMQSAADMDYTEMQMEIEKIKEVKNIHHVHTWLADEKTVFFEAHIEVDENLEVKELKSIYDSINHLLKEHYDVEHTTIQIEGNVCDDKELFKL